MDEITLRPGVRAEARDDDAYMALMGEVGWDIEPKEVAAALRQAKGKPLKVDIFSYGGDAMAGLAIYQMLASHDAEVTTNVLGIAASAASLIAMAGSKRKCASNAALMIHPAWGFTVGNAEEHRKQADVLEGITNAYLSAYCAASGRPPGEIEPYLMEETWLYGEDAFILGLATEVTDPISAMASAKQVPDQVFARLPEQLRGLIRQPVAKTVRASEPKPVHSIEAENPAEVEPVPAASVTMTDINEAAVAAQQARAAERDRISAIGALMKAHSMPDSLREELVESGASVEDARAAVLDRISTHKGEFTPGGITDAGGARIGMSEKEVQRYSFLKVAAYLADPSGRSAENAAFELEVSRAAQAKHSRSASGVLIPWDVLGAPARAAAETPGQVVGTFGDGGALVGTDRLTGSFIDLARNRSAFLNSGITVLSGLEGNVEIPKKLTSSQFYFVGENQDVNNSKLTFGLVTMIPRTIGVRVPISRRMMIQASPDIETLVRSDMAESLALGMDYNIGYGTGSGNRPLGILNTTGIGSVTFADGVDKAFPASLGGGTHDCGDWGDYVDLETALAVNNLDAGAIRMLCNSAVRGALKQTLRVSGDAGAGYIWRDDNTVNGYQSVVSNQMQTNDVLLGNMQDAMVGLWSGLDVVLDPYTQSASGQVILTVHQDFDVAVRRPESFALGT